MKSFVMELLLLLRDSFNSVRRIAL